MGEGIQDHCRAIERGVPASAIATLRHAVRTRCVTSSCPGTSPYPSPRALGRTQVTAVIADVTSTISREIATSPRRTRRPASAPGSHPALGMSAGAKQ